MDLARLRVLIDGDSKGAEKALSRTDAAIQSSSKKFGMGLGLVSGAIGAAGIAAAGAVAKMGLSTAAANEQASIAFTTLLGDAGKAQDYLKQLSEFAAKTPFELPGLRDAASRLIAVGTESSRVIPIMGALGDATSAMGTGAEGINRAVTALSQMQQKGKVTGEEMLQLAEAGVPAWDALASSMGKSVQETQKLVSTGKVSTEELFSAIENRSGAAMQRVSGMMDKQSQSLTGLLSTLKDTVSQQLGSAMAPAVEEIKKALPGITDAIGKTLEAIGPQIGPVFAVIADVASKLLPVLAPILGSLAGLFATLMTAASPILDVLIQAIGALTPALAPLGAMIGELATAFGAELANVLQALIPSLPPLVEALLTLAAAVLPSLVGVLELLGPLLTGVAVIISLAIGGAVKLVVPLIELLGKALEGIVDFLKGIPSTVADLAKNMWSPIANAFVSVLNFLIDSWNALDFKLPSFAGLEINGVKVIPSWEGSSLGMPDIPNIPKFHSGGIFQTTGSEGLALLRNGEGVFTPEQMRALGTQAVTIHSSPTVSISGSVYGVEDLNAHLDRAFAEHDRALVSQLAARGGRARR
jgi:tape measure domain-containing protein